MPVNLSAPNRQPAKPQEGWTRSALTGPEAGFFGTLLVGLGTLATLHLTVTADLVMPLVATLFLIAAALFGALAWWRAGREAGAASYRDIAGALVLIGVCASAAIDSEQIQRLLQ